MNDHTNIFNNKVILAIIVVAVLALGAGFQIVQATLETGPDVIPAPDVISDDPPGATNERQQAFDEAQEVTLPVDVRCDNTILSAGENVNSHMIFFNTRFDGISEDLNRTWTFEEEILCVMSNRNGLYQANTDNLLGAPGTDYPGPFDSRGLESDDSYQVNGNAITVSMRAEEPGDWIRVVTRWTTPEDTTAPVVYCSPTKANAKEPNANKPDKEPGGNLVELIGADDVDGEVDLYFTDSVSGTEFGPFISGTIIRHTIAKGAEPGQSESNSAAEFVIKTQGSATLSATDGAGNEGTATCQ